MTRIRLLSLFLLLTLGAAGLYLYAGQKGDEGNLQESDEMDIDIRGKVNAPDFEGAVGWLNVDKPLSIKDLRGKVVLLDFWTYCCINCMHVIPDLKKLEAKYPRELVVIGVHSAKFQNEKETENIRSAILRYEIEHPVANDANFRIWGQYGARGWPHLVIIDPEGKVVGALSGEGNYAVMDEVIRRLIAKFQGQLNLNPIPLALEKDKEPPTVLSFPGKIVADEEKSQLYIADSNHNRIVITDLEGKVHDIAGQGSIGLKDGAFEEASFNHPQGMVRVRDLLYVADTENHALRRLHLVERRVETVAGTGEQGRWGSEGGEAKTAKLNSPWDLAIREGDDKIYIAMAGPHQLWVYDPTKNIIEPFAGSGGEDIVDGPAPQAALAQPSGLASDGKNLFFADSEVSALRWVDFTTTPAQVKTFIGTGLFDFGDRDGKFKQALLQHPLGVAYQDGKIYITDTYNHKIKVANIENQTLSTLLGNGKPGVGTMEAPQFYEPGGLSIAGNRLYIADTNNNAIRVYDFDTKQTSTLHLDLSEWQLKNEPRVFNLFGDPTPIALGEQKLSVPGEAIIQFEFPEGFHLNEMAQPIALLRITGSGGKQWVSEKIRPKADGDQIRFSIHPEDLPDPKKVEIAVTYYYCRTDQQGQCMIGSALFEGEVGAGTAEPVTLTVAAKGV